MLQKLAIALALLLVGAAAGWHAKGVSVQAGETRTAKAETKAVVADVKQQAAAQHGEAVEEQHKTLAVTVEQSTIREHEHAMQQEIQHAEFTPAKPADPVDCTDPSASAEWLRLYNAAAAGSPAPAAASTAR